MVRVVGHGKLAANAGTRNLQPASRRRWPGCVTTRLRRARRKPPLRWLARCPAAMNGSWVSVTYRPPDSYDYDNDNSACWLPAPPDTGARDRPFGHAADRALLLARVPAGDLRVQGAAGAVDLLAGGKPVTERSYRGRRALLSRCDIRRCGLASIGLEAVSVAPNRSSSRAVIATPRPVPDIVTSIRALPWAVVSSAATASNARCVSARSRCCGESTGGGGRWCSRCCPAAKASAGRRHRPARRWPR